MKQIIAVLSIIATIVILVLGQMHWNSKTTVSVASEGVADGGKNTEIDSLLAHTTQWPADSVKKFQEKAQAGEPFHIAFLGSNALREGTDTWPELVKTALNETYGKHVTVSIFSYNLTSTVYVNEEKVEEIVAVEPDMVIFEPFTLKDNGEVVSEDSLENTAHVLAVINESLPETTVILQPPHPIYNAFHYPRQVEALAGFAADNGIPYLNHWEAWPDPKTEEIKSYLTEDASQPSTQGHEVWAQYLIDYLVKRGDGSHVSLK
ncbi:SGNH/GDSL hydrolase family protein [Niallia sp. XMNu-256]|uniref:SGNH/GDSL hydrolase family protein n=1 Tax=Niallia sp. XMNu-256 TaxID=3082444 RepID=UPI0030D0C889